MAAASTTEHYRTALRKGWRLTDTELENAWAAAKIVWAAEGLEGGSERYYALARIIEDRLMEKWRQRHT
jgi:hypothetical protein